MCIALRVSHSVKHTERNYSVELFACWAHFVCCPNMQIIRCEKFFFIPTSSALLAFGLALREISLNVNSGKASFIAMNAIHMCRQCHDWWLPTSASGRRVAELKKSLRSIWVISADMASRLYRGHCLNLMQTHLVYLLLKRIRVNLERIPPCVIRWKW